MLIRSTRPDDAPELWRILEPVIRAGETYALPRDMSREAARTYWTAPEKAVFVAEAEGRLLGTYLLRTNHPGGGSHVANCGYMTAGAATGRGVARAMCSHTLEEARNRGFQGCSSISWSVNHRAVRLWQSLGFAIVDRCKLAFRHPTEGYVDAYVMYQAL